MRRIFEIRNLVGENRLPHTFEEYWEIAEPFVDAGLCWVWDENGTVLGEVGHDPEAAYIEVLYVDPSAQGRGIGSALLERSCYELASAGCRKAFVSTAPGTGAVSFYRCRGWRDAGTEPSGDIRFEKGL
jgi:GNAT superfamily N-acetyltransferase